jgi:NodT family efflux transporter outer membrane factor (OMF) lipoprotein
METAMTPRILCPLGAALLVAGCMVGPDYVRPAAPTAPAYKEMQGWKQAEPRDAIARGRWWEIFGDPDLNALAERVDVSNQNVLAAAAAVRQAQAIAAQARAGLFPVVSAGATVTRSQSPSLSNQPSFATGPVTNYNALATASWELDLWGKVRRSVEAGEANWQASAADLASVKLSAQAALAQTYIALRVDDVQRKILEDTVAAYERTLELTRNRYAAGVAAKVDVVQAEVQLKSAQAQLVELGVERAQFEHAIASLVGEPASTFSVPPAPIVAVLPSIPVGVPSELLERRPDIAAAERSVATANAQIGVAQAAFYPTLTLSAAGGYRSTSLGDWISTPSRFWSLGAALAQNIFDGGLRRAVSDQAIAAYDGQVALYRQTVLTGFQEVEDNLAALRILEEEGLLQNEAARGAREAVELTTNQYKAGIVSFLNVIAAQTIALNNERTAVNVQGRRFLASVQLVRAIGGGWDARALDDLRLSRVADERTQAAAP